jgi:hypothetical protein
MSEKITPRDGAESWLPNQPVPSHVDVVSWQTRIDAIVGTKDARSIVKLAWAPSELRWYPHPYHAPPPGYTFPIFHAFTTAAGELVAAPRWVLLERVEPEQYGPTWELGRFSVYDGQLWDWKGPCPSERYTELRCHAAHDGICCPCLGETCECGVDYDHCWGQYLDPNDRLLDWIRETNYYVQRDSDVKPTQDVRFFEAPQAQQKLGTTLKEAQQKKKEEDRKFSEHMLSHWERKPHSTNGFKKTESGLYLAN